MQLRCQCNKPSGTLHKRLVSALSEEFARLPVGSRIPSGQALRGRFGVAYMTINRALDVLVERGEIIRRRGCGSFTARSQVRVIYYLLPQRDCSRIDTTIFRGALRQAQELGIRLESVIFSPDNTRLNVDFQSLEQIPEHAAVIVQSRWFYNGFDFLSRRHCRVAYVEQCGDRVRPELQDCHRLQLDRRKQLHEAVRLLKESGARRIFLITCNSHADDPVRSGFRCALRREGLAYNERQVLICNPNGYDGIFTAFRHFFLSGRFDYDAVLTHSAPQALAAFDVLARYGKSVPAQCALLSLAERDFLAARSVGITSLAFSEFEIGRRAVRLLAEGVSTGCTEMPFQLTRRDSVNLIPTPTTSNIRKGTALCPRNSRSLNSWS